MQGLDPAGVKVALKMSRPTSSGTRNAKHYAPKLYTGESILLRCQRIHLHGAVEC
jgi:hypothetical protein